MEKIHRALGADSTLLVAEQVETRSPRDAQDTQGREQMDAERHEDEKDNKAGQCPKEPQHPVRRHHDPRGRLKSSRRSPILIAVG